MTESLITQTSEKFVVIQMGLTVAEQRLIWRLRQLTTQQCRGVYLTLQSDGFCLSTLGKQENIGS